MTASTAPRTRGAMLLLFDVAADAIAEHDDWHTHEHMPERLAIPGFLRGTRWTRGAPELQQLSEPQAVAGTAAVPETRAAPGTRYCVVYEVADLVVLDSPAYRERLENPTPWTARMMARYAGMRRTLCEVVAGEGEGIGGACLLVTFEPAAGAARDLPRRLAQDTLQGLARRRGIASYRYLVNALPAPMTREQAIRGRDAAVHSALWITGYDDGTLAELAATALGVDRLTELGAASIRHAAFGLACAITAAGR